MVDYTFNKKQDRYFITNNEATDITYVLKKLNDCTSFLDIFGATIPAGEEVEVTLTGDGRYQIVLTNALSEESTVHINHFVDLQKSFIEDVFSVLCNCECGCKECEDGNPKCEGLLTTRVKQETFKRLMSPQYTSYLEVTYKAIDCLIDTQVFCAVNEEGVFGTSSFNEKLMKQIIALDYLAFFFYELHTACLTEDKEYVRCKFNSNAILCCISKLGIDIQDLENNLLDMASFTINSAAYVNQPATPGDNTIAVANRAVTTLTVAMFTTGTTPAYNDPEGDPLDAIRIDTLPADGVLKFNGIPVTAGQVVLASDIALNLLTFESPNQDPLDSDTFNFSVRDSGSLIFVS